MHAYAFLDKEGSCSGQSLLEKIYGSLPGKFFGCLVVAWGGIVMEIMVYLRIHMGGIVFIVFRLSLFVGWPSLINPPIQLCKVLQQGGLYGRNLFCIWLPSIKGHCSSQFRDPNGHHIRDPATKAKSHYPYFSITIFVVLEVVKSCDKIL